MEPFTPFVSLGFFLLFGRLPASLAGLLVTQPCEGIRVFTLPRGHSGFTLPLRPFSLAFRLLNFMRGFGSSPSLSGPPSAPPSALAFRLYEGIGSSPFLGGSGLHPSFLGCLLVPSGQRPTRVGCGAGGSFRSPPIGALL